MILPLTKTKMSTFIADNNAYSDSESDSDNDYNGYDDIPNVIWHLRKD